MTSLDELIERLEKAAEPGRELDAAIWACCQGVELAMVEDGIKNGERWRKLEAIVEFL